MHRALALLVISGCRTITPLEVPETLPKGTFELAAEAGLGTTITRAGNVPADPRPGLVSVSARRGFFDGFDAGLRVSAVGAEARGKLRVLQGDRWSLAVAPSLGAWWLDAYRGATATLLALGGWHVTERIELISGIQGLIWRDQWNTDVDCAELRYGYALTLGASFRVGSTARVLLEAGWGSFPFYKARCIDPDPPAGVPRPAPPTYSSGFYSDRLLQFGMAVSDTL